jgi:hypothetical protein
VNRTSGTILTLCRPQKYAVPPTNTRPAHLPVEW